ncbi:predicted protein [Sparassis crispa]|uniref:UvrD-like helicase ATP-binding domain-containing protein n=1 Tax=Sparassis crispa TaxID=139825 RepID=A0A401GDA2_9APHY|nr:predicted protein [Sparassis crispa]GBE80111.1 predicted protein [Sparassis crispa]
MKNFKTQKRAHASLDLNILDGRLLCDEVALEIAIGVLETHLDNRAADIEVLVEDLFPSQHLLEFSLSVICDATFIAVSQRLLDNFPKDPRIFSSSLACKLIERFSLYHYFLSYPPSEEPLDLRERRQSAQLSTRALEALLTSSLFADDLGASGSKPSKRKKASGTSARPGGVSLESKPFHDLRMDVPHSRREAEGLADHIMRNLKEVLQYYLNVFRYPQLRNIFKGTYIPEHAPSDDVVVVSPKCHASHGPASVSQEVSKPTVDNGSEIFPTMQHAQMTLDADNADGFGGWRVLISKPAASDLRQKFKKDPELFRIIMKKIRELSNGPSFWTQDNHKRMNVRNEFDVPIYAAKLARDSRLIYQIDCVPDFQRNVDTQVLKIFGIFTHAQMGEHLWDSVGHSLSGKGREYKRRCVFRNQSVNSVVLPACFPPLSVSESQQRSSSLPTLHKEDLGKLHELLVLDKYYPFSKALLNSILGDLELSLVFQVSTEEQRIVEHQDSCYVIGRSGTGKTTTMLFKMLRIERLWHLDGDRLPKPRQLFVTKSRVLAEKVQQHFGQLIEAHGAADLSLQALSAMKTKMNILPSGLYDADEMADLGSYLPKRWTALRDEHFPMFITYDELARLLENDMTTSGITQSTALARQRRSFVTYDRFRMAYWPHFPQPLTKGLDATLVFAEFMGVIKGSEEALASSAKYLDKDNYQKLKNRRSHAIVANQADVIYQLFLIYSRMKRERGEYDVADRTHRIWDGLRDDGVPGRQVSFLYVDEVQDNLLIDLLVLRMLCGNSSGLFWAGDTAQTISVGSAFKFNDLRAFMHRVETTVISSSRPRAEPEFFQLCVNYRSHAGIVNCAQSVIELLMLFWPNSIDSLTQEKALIDGPKPMFFNGRDENSVQYEQFLFGDSGSGNSVEFGAKQCILVRDDAARERLRARVGEVGTIFTLYESKGQEFDDVLLYNFFEDSTVDSAKFRVVLNALPQQYSQQYSTPAPLFDDIGHSSICHELKCLYVAITRARKTLWIADNPDKFDPMRIFWTSRDQIDVWIPGSKVPRLATSSTSEEWAHAARTHFENKHYTQAMHAYDKASMAGEKAVAEAFYLREKARNTLDVGGTARSIAFGDAAEAFRVRAEIATARERKAYFRIAAQCYGESGKPRPAAQCYIHADDYAEAALSLRDAELFDEAVQIIQSHRIHVEEADADLVISSAISYYFKKSEARKAIPLFSSPDKALAYMEECDLDVERVKYLERLNRFSDAADLHLAKGLPLKAIQLYLKCPQDMRSVRRAEQCLLGQLWLHLSFGVKPTTEKKIFRDLADFTTQFSGLSNATPNSQRLISMFRAALTDDLKQLHLLYPTLLSGDIAARLLCLDHIFMGTACFKKSDQAEAATILENFRLYLNLMAKVAEGQYSGIDPALRQLFGIQYSIPNGYVLSAGTFLHRMAAVFGSHSVKAERTRHPKKSISLSIAELVLLIRHSLQDRLRSRITQEDGVFRQTYIFAPCLSFAIFGCCNDGPATCLRDHSIADSLDSSSYHTRIGILLSRIVIYERFHWVFSDDKFGYQMMQRSILEDLYHAVIPSMLVCTSVPALTADCIPAFDEGIQVVKRWIQSLICDRQSLLRSNLWLTTAELMTLEFFLSRIQVKRDIEIATIFRNCSLIHLLRGWEDDRRDTVRDLLWALKALGSSGTSFGVLYAVHILDHKLPADLNVLCDLLEYLCGSFVLLDRTQSVHQLHDITLPRRWLLNFERWNLERVDYDDCEFLAIFLRPMSALLGGLYTGQDIDYLSLDGSKIDSDQGSRFILRICRMLALLGYNSQNEEFKWDVLSVLKSLRSTNFQSKLPYSSYINVSGWDDVVDALQPTFPETCMDQLLHLSKRDMTKGVIHGKRLKGIHRVTFWHSEQILPSVAADLEFSARATRTARTNPIVEPPASPVIAIHKSITVGPAPRQDLIEMAEDQIEDRDDVHSTASDLEEPADDEAMSIAVSEEKIAAASYFARTYRRILNRRRNETETQVSRLFSACLLENQAESSNVRGGRYRLFFLGPLPHILLSLQGILTHAESSKKVAKAHFTSAVGMEQDRWKVQLTKDTSLIRDAKRLQKILEPSSNLHIKGDLCELKSQFMEVAELGSKYDIPREVAKRWEEDLRLAVMVFAAHT